MSLCVGEPSSMQHAVFDFPRRTCPFVSTHLLFYFYFSVLFIFLIYLFLVLVFSLSLYLGIPWRPARCLRTRADSRLGRLRSIAPRRLATSIGRQRTDSALAVLGVDVELKSLFCAQRMLSVFLALARSTQGLPSRLDGRACWLYWLAIAH